MTEITLKDLTEGKINGVGVFDELMKSINAHLLEQFDKNRIVGETYGQVYLGSLQSTLQEASNFLLQKDKVASETALVNAQISKLKAEERLIDAQISLTAVEETKVTKEVEHMTQQIELSKAEILKINAERERIAEEVLVMRAKRETEVAMRLKLQAESNLLAQRLITERAQTTDPTGGILGAQMGVLNAQRDGFSNDYKVKSLKAVNDVYAIAKSNDPDAVAYPTILLAELTEKIQAL